MEKESMEKSLAYMQDLQAEEECLRNIIAKLNEQAHALQVRIYKFQDINSFKLKWFKKIIRYKFTGRTTPYFKCYKQKC